MPGSRVANSETFAISQPSDVEIRIERNCATWLADQHRVLRTVSGRRFTCDHHIYCRRQQNAHGAGGGVPVDGSEQRMLMAEVSPQSAVNLARVILSFGGRC